MTDDDHCTMTHMLGVQAAELAVTFCRAGLFPAVGAAIAAHNEGVTK